MSENTEEDSGGLCCQTCSPFCRKMGYYITFLLGLLVFGFGIFQLIAEQVVYYLIGGSLAILLCPLWVQNCSTCLAGFKNALKVTSALIFILFLAGTIVVRILLPNSPVLIVILGVCLAISGFWYFLSFFPGGQQGCVDCIKGCCCKSSESA
jgi:hypothetical protein